MRQSVVIMLAVLLLAAGGVAVMQSRVWQEPQDPAQTTTAAADHVRSAIALAESKGCRACHSIDGSAGIGPSWVGSYGGKRTFVDGSQATADEAYLRESILQPAARVVAGYQNLMVVAVLQEDEVTTLIGLIRQLSQGALE